MSIALPPRPRAPLAVALLAAVALCACATPSLDHIPREQRPEAQRRLERCNELATALRPSSDRAGELSILGTGVSFRDAEQNQNTARDQYLAALSGLLTSCRSWQNFEITTQQFRQDRIEFASVYTAAIDGSEDAASRERVIAALARAEAIQPGQTIDEAVRRLEETAASWSTPTGLTEQLSEIASRLRILEERGQGGTSSLRDEDGTRPEREPGTNTERFLVLGFASGSSSLDDRMRTELAQFIASGPTEVLAVVGYADEVGDSPSNTALSLERARSVASALHADGVRVAHVAGAGETAAFGEGLADNRVVIVLRSDRLNP